MHTMTLTPKLGLTVTSRLERLSLQPVSQKGREVDQVSHHFCLINTVLPNNLTLDGMAFRVHH